jgi:hypothetical protein
MFSAKVMVMVVARLHLSSKDSNKEWLDPVAAKTFCTFCASFMAPKSSAEKDRARTRPMNLDMAIRAIRVLRVQVVLWTSGLIRADAVRDAVTRQTELCNAARRQ